VATVVTRSGQLNALRFSEHRREPNRACNSCRARLSAVSYDALFNCRHNGIDRTEKVGHEINCGFYNKCIIIRHILKLWRHFSRRLQNIAVCRWEMPGFF